MADKNNLTELFKTLQKALGSHSVDDITEAVSSYLSKKEDKHEEIHYVLEIVCEEFNISHRILRESSMRGEVTVARNIAYCILYNELGLPLRYISKTVMKKKGWTGASVAVSYFKSLNPGVKVDREFKERYDRLVVRLGEFIKNKNRAI